MCSCTQWLGHWSGGSFDSGRNRSNKVTDLFSGQTAVMDAPSPALSPPQRGRGETGEYESTFSRLSQITDALTPANITTFVYDDVNRKTTITDPEGKQTVIQYNTAGQPTSITDPLTHATSFGYDVQGNLATTTDALSNVTTRYYDAVSRLIGVTDPRGMLTRFSYDDLNRVTQIQDALGGMTSFTYDPNGNLLSVTDAKNQTTTYTYDEMDRLTTRKDELNRTKSYEYDKAGNLAKFTDRKNQASSFTYDGLNRRTGATYVGSSTTFGYDAIGRLTSVSDSVGGNITWVYAVVGQHPRVAETTSAGTVTVEYDNIGRRFKLSATGQSDVTYAYDKNSRLKTVTQGTQTVTLAYDDAGRRTSLTYPNGVVTSYGFDNANRLLTLAHVKTPTTIESLTYQYDAAGNRVSLTRANAAASLIPQAVSNTAYDGANQQTQFNGTTLTYDANGNLTNDGTTTYTWDARNRLTGLSGAVTASFTYDGLGRRTRKTISGTTTGYWFDGNDIVAELNGSTPIATYLRSLNIDEPCVRQQSGGNEFFQTDALGSTVGLTDSAGASQTTYSYEPFGKTTVTGTSSNPFQYTGRENDGTGLYYYRARYFSSGMHRFVSEDPVGLKGGDINFYAYVLDHPINNVDSLGLRVDFGNYVIGNSYVIANLERLNQQIVNQGIPDDKFVLRVTGGDRYINTDDGLLRSLTDNTFVSTKPNQDPKLSPHLRENGARAVDLDVVGVSNDVVDKALKKTDFEPARTSRDYPDAPHTHIELPKNPKFYYQPWKR